MHPKTTQTSLRRRCYHDGGTRALVKPINLVISISLLLAVSIRIASATTSDNSNQFGSKLARPTDDEAAGGQIRPMALVYTGGNDEKPRLIPLVAAESGYSENSSVNILCTVSQGHHDTLTFDWFKDGHLLMNYDNGNMLVKPTAGDELGNLNLAPPQIEKHSDHSLLRISRVHSQHSGRYTCSAKNQFGQDSSSVNLIVNVKLQWIKEPPKEVVVSVNQELKVDCLAQGEPRPTMRWERLDSSMSMLPRARASGAQFQSQTIGGANDGLMMPMGGAAIKNQLATKESNGYKLAPAGFVGSQNSVLVSSNRYLNIQRAKESDSGIYECVASNSHDTDLRKLVHVQVRDPLQQDKMLAQRAPKSTVKRLPSLFAAAILVAVIVQQVVGQQNGELKRQALAADQNGYSRGRAQDDADQQHALANDQVKIQYVNVNGLPVLVQFTYVGPPKILPIATADSYPEGSSINLICTVSGGQRRGLVLSWMMNGEELTDERVKYSGAFDNLSIGTDDADISILRIKNATNANSGQYTCTAKNPLGQDSTSVKIVINVELKWTKIPKDVEVGLNQEMVVECDAVGQPQPIIEWLKHSTHLDSKSNGTMLISKNRILKLNKAQHKDSGLYECIARNGVDEDLRRVIQVKVRGK